MLTWKKPGDPITERNQRQAKLRKTTKNWGGDGQNCVKTHTTKWTTGGDMGFFHVS